METTRPETESLTTGYALAMLAEAAELSGHGARFADEVYDKVKEAAADHLNREHRVETFTPDEQGRLVKALITLEPEMSQRMAKSTIDFFVETVGELA